MPTYKVLRDTAEKKGLPVPCSPAIKWLMEEQRMETGDYTVDGLQKIIRIERKVAPPGNAELVKCLAIGEGAEYLKSGKHRFEDQLDRLATFPVKRLLIEGSPQDCLRWKSPGTSLTKEENTKLRALQLVRLESMCAERGIPVAWVPGKRGPLTPWVFGAILEGCLAEYRKGL